MSYSNILEFIDEKTNSKVFTTYFIVLPTDAFGLCIEESNATVGDDLSGLTQEISSTTQFYVRSKVESLTYTEIDSELKRMHKSLYDLQGGVYENVELIRVGPYRIDRFSVENEKMWLVSTLFTIKYKLT